MNSLIEIQSIRREIIKQGESTVKKEHEHDYMKRKKKRMRKKKQRTSLQCTDVIPQLDDRCLCLFS